MTKEMTDSKANKAVIGFKVVQRRSSKVVAIQESTNVKYRS